MSQFKDILNTPTEDIKQRPPFPEGMVAFAVLDYNFAEVGEKNTPKVTAKCRVREVLDVDEDQLAAYGEMPENGAVLEHVMWATENGRVQIKKFCAACGVNVDKKGITLGQMLEQAKGATAKGLVKHEVDQRDNETVYARIDRVFALD